MSTCVQVWHLSTLRLTKKISTLLSYFMSSVHILKSQGQVEIQTTSEMTPYFIVTKCNNCLLHTLLAQQNALPSNVSTISMKVVKTMLFNTRARCSVKCKV